MLLWLVISVFHHALEHDSLIHIFDHLISHYNRLAGNDDETP